MKFLITILALSFMLSCRETPHSVDIDELTISEIKKAYQNQSLSSEELVMAYLKRIDTLKTRLNAITYINPDAIAIAQQKDKEMNEGKATGALHGIPIIVKDNINVKGMPTTAGSAVLTDYIPTEDAFIIQRLKDAGAIILAKSNMAEWAFSAKHTESSTHGTTHNPYGLDHVPAGSSGGTAAAIAANLGAAGLGTDTGNSIRGPSSHGSLVGFRTTLGLISRSGIVPLMLRNDVVGPMCRTVADATIMMQVMAGVDPADSITQYSTPQPTVVYSDHLQPAGLQGAKIGVLRELMPDDTDSDITALFEQALKDMSSAGATIVDTLVIPDFVRLSQDQWCSEFKQDIEEFLSVYVKSDSLQTLQDIIDTGIATDYARGRLERYTTKTDRWGDSTVPCGDAYTDPLRIAYRNAIRSVMDSLQLDAIVYPSWTHPPALIESYEEGYKGDNSQIICPHTGQPGFTVPMGFTATGLPAGIQFLGRMYEEATLVRLCYSYEQATQHRRSPTWD